ncbi:hypothetical protein B0H19DRAFT_1276611 [Mycena capillaripes]|nr:hypothetical protein B0H19DRAFT_1276611 [Mycena capillaripes]
MFKLVGLGLAIFLVSLVSAEGIPAFGQCDGIGFSGVTTCASGYACVSLSKDYSQCTKDHDSGLVTQEEELVTRAEVAPLAGAAVSVVIKNASLGPTPPAGLKYTHLTTSSPDSEDEAHYPVLMIAGYSYWALSYIDNRNGLAILTYDPNNNLAGRFDTTGTRYVISITYNSATGSVVFNGQSGPITVPIIQLLTPIVFQSSANANVQATPPAGLKFTHLTNPNTLDENDSVYPVLIVGTYTYWPMSYIDNRVSLNLVGYDQNKNLVSQLEVPGTRYIFTLGYSPIKGAIQLIGQSNAAVTVNITQVV